MMRNYMMERFLERISLSDYKNRFILKGGMLVAAMVGLDARSTMDLDATVKGANVNVEDVESIISSILSVPMEDGVRTPLKIDISTGDVITPCEIRYSFKLMLEERSIEVWAYNLETVLAEKLETVSSRNVTNTRMRDFYDIHILQQLYGEILCGSVFQDALAATATKRGTLEQMKDAAAVFDEVEESPVMEKLWQSYQKNYSYAAELSWHMAMDSVRALYVVGNSV